MESEKQRIAACQKKEEDCFKILTLKRKRRRKLKKSINGTTA